MPKGSFSIPVISVDFVKKEIQAMSNSKATGLDLKLLKLSLDVITEILTFLLNMSLKNCEVAYEWKKARVTPIFKSGENFIVNNYRPVSVLPVVSKIIERHVFDSFYEYLNTNNLLTEQQSGFSLDLSTRVKLHYITSLTNGKKNIDDGKLTGVLFIDLSKAFDTVNYEVLLHKLLSFGICNNSFK